MSDFAKLVISCACCGAQKGENNHWWLTKVDEHKHFHARPLDPAKKLTRRDKPVCGQDCALKMFGRYLDENRVQANSPNSVAVDEPKPPVGGH